MLYIALQAVQHLVRLLASTKEADKHTSMGSHHGTNQLLPVCSLVWILCVLLSASQVLADIFDTV